MNEIIWERWKDPLRPLLKDQPHQEDSLELSRSLRSFGPEEDDGEELNARFGDSGGSEMGPGIVASIGIVPIRESNIPSRLFKFWMGHTNFKITKPLLKRIEAVLGVEAIDVFTPYRFRMAVGKAFDSELVKEAVERSVQPTPPPKPVQPKMRGKVSRQLSDMFPFWASAKVEGRNRFYAGNSQQEVESQIEAGASRVVKSWE